MRRKLINVLALFWLSLPLIGESEVPLGEETIQPLKYPKFSLSMDYNLGRKFHDFADPKLREDLANQFGGALSFEAGLYEYFNAGAIFSVNMAKLTKLEPLHIRLSLFGKPYIALTDRFGVFGRVGAGISSAISVFAMNGYLSQEGSSTIKRELKRVYKEGSYSMIAYGANTFASLGVEYFPFSRFGLALEAGIRAEFFRASKTNNLFTRKTDARAPSALCYMIYEFPISLMLHIIL